ncbi:hypothetical protein FYC62_03395 [Pedobacter aquae]|uniref:Uncharacterized protein n=1 Tax=Pedobacter aquae TaxID=2605747 RepID=A0A5C0VGT4_9SPHI|nr:hypothetical protein FYC62_03395 [Pedobacter aquae]
MGCYFLLFPPILQTEVYELPTFSTQTSDSGLRTLNFLLFPPRLRTAVYELPTFFYAQTSDSGLRTSDSGPRTSDSGLWTSDSGLRTLNFHLILNPNPINQ